MKKTFLSLAIAAAGMGVMAACGQKSAKSGAEGTDATAPETATDDKDPAPTGKTIDQPTYSLALPEGWNVMSEDEREAIVYKGESEKDFMNGPWLMSKVCKDFDMTFDEYYKEMIKETEGREADDVTIGGITYRTCIATERGEDSHLLLGQQPKGIVLFVVSNATPDNPDVQAIIGSMKRK